jgi:hypothetical protein
MSDTINAPVLGQSSVGDVTISRGAAPINITDTIITTVVRAWIMDIIGNGVPVVLGQDPAVPEPVEDDWIEMTMGPLRQRLGTNVIEYFDPEAGVELSLENQPYANGQRIVTNMVQVNLQIDVHGPNSSTYVTIIETLFRDDDSCYFFAGQNSGLTPLYSSDPRQMAFINEGAQAEDRWTIDLSIQANFVVTRPQQFAGELELSINGYQ